MKKLRGMLVVMALTVFCTAALAGGHRDGGPGGKPDFAQKVIGKAHMMMVYADEIGLSEEQVGKIKDIKIKLKKDMIMKGAEIDVLKVDIMAALYADKIDKDAVDAMIDKKYELKKAKAKELVGACINLQSVLTEEQMGKMKALCTQQKKQKCGPGRPGPGKK